MKLRLTTLALAMTLAGTANLAVAGSESGFYLGGSLGTAQIDYAESDPDLGQVEFDDDASAYKLFAGYNIGLVPFLNLAVEAGYVDLGSYKGSIAAVAGNEIEADGFTGFGLVGLDMGPVGVFGKVGMLDWDGDVITPVGTFSDSGTDPAYGIGAKTQLGPFAVRMEYEKFELENFDIDCYTVGAAYTF